MVNKYNIGTKEEVEKRFPLFSKDLPTFENWIPQLIKEKIIFFYRLPFDQYIQHLKDIGIYEEIQEIHLQHKYKYTWLLHRDELKLWLEKYPKYYPECKKIWEWL